MQIGRISGRSLLLQRRQPGQRVADLFFLETAADSLRDNLSGSG